jgi:hypothetical protein
LVSCLLWAQTAAAHFDLQNPANWMSQDALGTPQKAPPCGNEAGGTATGKITPYQTGATVQIQLTETVFHPGHYRVALSTKADRSDLPAEPAVTAGATQPCGTAAVMSPAVFPVLVDGALDHTTAFAGAQTISVKLPDGLTCDHCTLQIIEFMSNHALNNPGGCFYHHCADISIQNAPVTPMDMSDTGDASLIIATDDGGGLSLPDVLADMSASGNDGGNSKPKAASAGVPGCEVGGTDTSSSLMALALLIAGVLSFRERRPRAE